MILARYMTRGFIGNAVRTPVHVFASDHDPRSLASPKRHLTATVYESLSRQRPGAAYQVLVASSNDILSAHIDSERATHMEIVPLGTAKHMAELLGIGLVVLEGAHCDTHSSELWWDLYYYTPNAAARYAMGREILT